jgi:light-independent protochlorophyllide reductase subunit B
LGGAVAPRLPAAEADLNIAAKEASAANLAAGIAISAAAESSAVAVAVTWAEDAEKELRKIPFFVRGKARRNTEIFARDKGLLAITVETIYDAKAHFSR